MYSSVRHKFDQAVADADAGISTLGQSKETPNDLLTLAGQHMGDLLKLLSPAVLEDAKSHVVDVRESSLRWTVVRVPRLGEGDPRGDYRTDEDLQLGFEAVARADVASFMLDVVEDDRYIGQLPKIGY